MECHTKACSERFCMRIMSLTPFCFASLEPGWTIIGQNKTGIGQNWTRNGHLVVLVRT